LYYIINVPTYFKQLYGHTQATPVHRTKIATADFIVCHNAAQYVNKIEYLYALLKRLKSHSDQK